VQAQKLGRGQEVVELEFFGQVPDAAARVAVPD
jgi:hypothetical protein